MIGNPKLHIPEPLENVPVHFLIKAIRGESLSNDQALFMPKYKFNFEVDLTDIEKADFVLLPHALKTIDNKLEEYINNIKQKTKKPIVVMVTGDLSHNVNISGCLLLKGTQYKSLKKDNEIMIAPICEDLGFFYGFEPRDKGDIPSIGFCGWAGFPNFLQRIKFTIKIILKYGSVFRQGLYFRRKAIKILNNTKRIKTNFILRKTFSGRKDSIERDPEQARTEFIQNIKDSDFVLTVKGDANYSVRFFEALSIGRIPVLIDTDVCLPFENEINYDDFMIRVPYKNISKVGQYIKDFYNNISPEEFIRKQKMAREVFEEYLRYDSCYNRVFRYVVNTKDK